MEWDNEAECRWSRLSPSERQNALSSDNLYYTWLALNRPPTVADAVHHYYTHTGPHFTEFTVTEESFLAVAA